LIIAPVGLLALFAGGERERELASSFHKFQTGIIRLIFVLALSISARSLLSRAPSSYSSLTE